MSQFLARLEKPLMKIAGKLGQQPHLNAIRDGVVSALPLVLIGSLFMLVARPPLPSKLMMDHYKSQPFVSDLMVGYLLLAGLVSLFVAFAVAHSLAKRYEQDALSAGLLALASLLLINGFTQSIAINGTSFTAGGPGRAVPDYLISVSNLGSGGLFMALILGLLVPEVQRLARKYKLEIHMPTGVPPAVGRSFSALIPGLLVIIPLWIIVHLFHVDLFAMVSMILAKPVLAMSQPGATGYIIMLAIILIDSVLWLLGVHPVAVLAPMAAIWLLNITGNGLHGYHLLNTREAFQFYIWLGGSGATLVLPYLLLRARSTSLRAIAKVAAVPALFNINEPLIFGVPVVMNAALIIPFILAPIITLTTTTIATHTGLIPVPYLVVPWTLPGPIGAFFATGGAWSAAALSLVNIALAALIYWPFVRALDRKMAEQEAVAPEGQPASSAVVA